MIIRMIRDKLGINVQIRTLRRALRRAGISFRKPKAYPAQLCIRTGTGRVQDEPSGDSRPPSRRWARRLLPERDGLQIGGCISPEIDTARNQSNCQDKILQKVDQIVRYSGLGQAACHARRGGKLDNIHLCKLCARSMTG